MADEITKYFNWLIVILDDQASSAIAVEKAFETLQTFGFNVKIFSSPIELKEWLLGSNHADLYIIDLKWERLKLRNIDISNVSNISIDELNNMSPNEQDRLMSIWISGITYCLVNDPPGETVKGEPFLIRRTREIEYGTWIASLLSWVDPTAYSILWSENWREGVMDADHIHALRLFRDSKFVFSNKVTEGVDIEYVWRYLLRRQRSVLSQREDIYRWFLEDVFFPRLFHKNETRSKKMHSVFPEQKEKVLYSEETFFPQIKKAAEDEKYDILKEFLRIEDRGIIESWQEDALHSVRHELKREKLNACKSMEELKKQVKRGLKDCFNAGTPGEIVSAHLSKCFNVQSENELKDMAENAVEEINIILSNREIDLKNLCHDYHGEFSIDESVNAFSTIDENKSNPRLPFNIFNLERALMALRDNAEKAFGNKEIQDKLSYKLNTEIKKGDELELLVVTWLDNTGFSDYETFIKAMIESIKEGYHRGLPLVILFGLNAGALTIEILIQKQWYTIWSKYHLPKSRIVISEDHEGFGVRWTFQANGTK